MAISGSYDYFKVQAKGARIDLNKYFHDPQVESLHRFRVEIKKIRAVFIQLEDLSGSNQVKKLHQGIKKIFRKAGVIRELQLEKTWLEKHRKFDLLRLMQYEPSLRKADKAFHQNIPKMLDALKKISRKMEGRLIKITQQQTDEYISKKWQSVLRPLLSNIDESHWHETRKGIKQLVYARHWISPDRILQKKVLSIFLSMDKLQNYIGNWHDLDLLAQKLQAIEGKTSGHAILQREQQLALKRLHIEKENLAHKIRTGLSKIKILIHGYK